ALKLYQGKVHLACQALEISRSLMYQLIQKYDLKNYTVTPPANTPFEKWRGRNGRSPVSTGMAPS
ncbi:MAG: hypothetical protein WB948_01275, partial [Desulfobaccales bacterium]